MTVRLNFPKLTGQISLFVDDKSAALDAHHFFAVHIFFFDHIKQTTGLFTFIRQKLKTKTVFALKLIMGFHGVPRDSEHNRIRLFKLLEQLRELLAFQGAAGSVILGVKVQNHFSASVFGQIVHVPQRVR